MNIDYIIIALLVALQTITLIEVFKIGVVCGWDACECSARRRKAARARRAPSESK